MAIQVRRGLEKDFDPEKALPGEWLLSTDTRYIRMCITPGVVLRMATYEAFEADMVKIQAVLEECKDIQSTINSIQSIVASKAALTVEYANSAAEYAKAAAASEANAKMYAENASAVTGVGIATQDTAGLMKGGENYVDESGALVLTKTTTDTTLPNSHAGGIKLLGLYGASKQESTTGAQLLPCVIFGSKGVADNITWEISKEGFKASGTPNKQYSALISADLSLAVGTYYISGGNRTDNLYARIAVVKNGVTSHYINTTFSIDGTEEIVNYAIQTGAEIVAINDTIYPMLNAGTTALPWEKFTGGAPSPSIDYPQEIKKPVVSGIWGHGKNFLNVSNVTEYFETSKMFNVSLLPNTYTFSCANTESKRARIYYKDGTYVDVISWNTSKVCTFTTDKVAIGILVNSNTKIDLSTWCCQLEEGTEATPYEPYQSFSHTLSQPIELNEGDCLTPQNTARKMGVAVFDGSEEWVASAALTGRYGYYLEEKKNGYCMCTCAKYNANLSNVQNECFLNAGGHFYINTPFGTLEEWKAYLAEKPITVVYELADPITEELPTADQIALNSLKSFDGTTHIYCDCGEVQATMKLKYGTSEVGALALENHCRENVHEIRLNELTTAMLVINQE